MPEATIALLCCLDAFARLLEQWERHHLLPSGRQRRRGGTLSLGEMFFLMVLLPISVQGLQAFLARRPQARVPGLL